MADFRKIWIEQCEATIGIQENFGIEKALDYLIGEKMVHFIQASDRYPEFLQELPKFVAEVKRIFQPWKIQEYLEYVCHRAPKQEALTKSVGMFQRNDFAAFDVIREAEDILLLERVKGLLLT